MGLAPRDGSAPLTFATWDRRQTNLARAVVRPLCPVRSGQGVEIRPPPQNLWVTEGPIFMQMTVIAEVALTAGCSRFDARFLLGTEAPCPIAAHDCRSPTILQAGPGRPRCGKESLVPNRNALTNRPRRAIFTFRTGLCPCATQGDHPPDSHVRISRISPSTWRQDP